jgi:hypothetical protein
VPPKKKRNFSRTDAERDALRFAAETFYVLNPNEVSASSMCQMEQFSTVPVSTMVRWCDQGSWPVKRQDHLDTLRGMLRDRMAQRMVHSRIEQLDAMQDMWDQGIHMLADERLVPKLGWEGVAQTVLRIGHSINETRAQTAMDLLGEQKPADATSQQVPHDMMPELEQDEAMAAARAIVEVRQRKLRALPAPEGS